MTFPDRYVLMVTKKLAQHVLRSKPPALPPDHRNACTATLSDVDQNGPVLLIYCLLLLFKVRWGLGIEKA